MIGVMTEFDSDTLWSIILITNHSAMSINFHLDLRQKWMSTIPFSILIFTVSFLIVEPSFHKLYIHENKIKNLSFNLCH
jgi:hypothetical protein